MESARANELDVYEYLKYLLTETPNNHHLEDPSVIDSLLPWSKELPEQVPFKKEQKKSASNIDVGIIAGTLAFFFSLSTLFPIFILLFIDLLTLLYPF